MEKEVRGRARTERGNTRGGATKKHEISSTFFPHKSALLSIWFMEETSQFSVGQSSQSLTSSIMEKPHTGLDDCAAGML